MLLFEHHSRRNFAQTEVDRLLMIIGLTIPWGFLGAVVFDKIMHVQELSSIQKSLFQYTGMSFIGGLILAVVIYSFTYGVVFHGYRQFLKHTNSLVPYVALAHGFGRIGCFLGACCYGKPSHSIFAVQFPEQSLAVQHYGMVPVLPTQLFEAGLLLLIFLVTGNAKEKLKLYLIMYGTGRFLLEFLRGDNRGTIGNQVLVSPSQVVCLVIVLLTLLYMGYQGITQKKDWKL